MEPGIGYCQGMNFIVAFLLQYYQEEDAFWILVMAIRKSRDIWNDPLNGGKTFETLDNLIERHLPDLKSHFDQIGLASSALFTPIWFQSLFMHPDISDEYLSLRVWDHFLA